MYYKFTLHFFLRLISWGIGFLLSLSPIQNLGLREHRTVMDGQVLVAIENI